jgi:hypothetical protein
MPPTCQTICLLDHVLEDGLLIDFSLSMKSLVKRRT